MQENNLEKIYYKRNFSRLNSAGQYAKERGGMFSRWIGKNKKVLDIGCRSGLLTKYFSQGNDLVGVDIDKNALEIFEKEIGGKIFNIDLNNEWPFEREIFDSIVASEVLEHLYKPELTIINIKNSLKSDGIFIGSVPNAFSFINRIRLFLAKPEKTALADPTHVHQFSYKELEKLLKKYFKVVELYPLINPRFQILSRISPSFFSFLIIFYCKEPVNV